MVSMGQECLLDWIRICWKKLGDDENCSFLKCSYDEEDNIVEMSIHVDKNFVQISTVPYRGF